MLTALVLVYYTYQLQRYNRKVNKTYDVNKIENKTLNLK